MNNIRSRVAETVYADLIFAWPTENSENKISQV